MQKKKVNRSRTTGPFVLPPADIQSIKAAGVTFVRSMVERVIEEQAKGEASKAEEIRAAFTKEVGASLTTVRPGSPEAAKLKAAFISRWSFFFLHCI